MAPFAQLSLIHLSTVHVLAYFRRTSTMDLHLAIPATEKTPAVEMRPDQGLLTISGCSIPENADRFYSKIQDEVERYTTAPQPRTTVRIALSYFNSSTSKYLLDLLKRLEDLHASGRSQVVLEWYFPKGDLDMKEAGEDYRSLVEFPVKLKELDE